MSQPDAPPDRPLVLVVVGTDHHPFTRLVEWVDAWLAQIGDEVECVIQYGCAIPPVRGVAVDYLGHDDLMKLVERCAAVVTHGGPATIIDCRRRGRLPIAVPRRHAYGEHVDDHQVRFVGRLAADGHVLLAESATELAELLDRGVKDPSTLAAPPDAAHSADAAVARFGELVAELCAQGPQRRRPQRAHRRR